MVLTNADWPRATHRLVERLVEALAALRDRLADELQPYRDWFPADTDLHSGRITRGWNHEQCPYVVLDFPRWIAGKEFLFFRTLIWLGHHYSFSVIGNGAVAQPYWQAFREKCGKEWMGAVGEAVWRNRPEGYRPLRALPAEESLWRVGRFYSLEEWALWPKRIREAMHQILQCR